MWWSESIETLKGIGKKKALDFAKLNINTLGDLLNYYPRSYVDQSQIVQIADLDVNGAKQLFKGEILRITNRISARKMRYSVVTLTDGSDYIELYLFAHQQYQARQYKPGMQLLVVAKIQPGRSCKMATEAFVQIVKDGQNVQAPGILPIYGLSGSLTQQNVRNAVNEALLLADDSLPETLPQKILNIKEIPSRLTALRNIHFPESFTLLAQARKRFIFEELFLLQCGLLYYRKRFKDFRIGLKMAKDGKAVHTVLRVLPFKLTEAQQKAWLDISLDMQDIKPMHRLLQGDVGSGKTAVAVLALAKAAENGFQGCIMVPTGILAQQHYDTMAPLLGAAGINTALLTSGTKTAERKLLLQQLACGQLSVLIGTHALIQDDVIFDKLALVITDEQHRFGVEQRAKLSNKSQFAPDVLIMTATPIPRTLALTVYGDLDVTSMQGLPPGRQSIETLCYTGAKRRQVYEGMVRQIKAGHQVYVVCASIEAGELPGVRAAVDVYNELKNSYLKDIECALLHGKLKQQDKDDIMQRFAGGEIKVLVSTTVIEVGMNVPNASLMIIENADRFGLAQIHQLRGRVGRGSVKSYCVLLTDVDNEEALERLNVLHTSNDGFYLAEKDLELRGSGQLFGLRQHGLPDLYIADILKDTAVLVEARALAKESLQDETFLAQLETLLSAQFDDRFSRIFNA